MLMVSQINFMGTDFMSVTQMTVLATFNKFSCKIPSPPEHISVAPGEKFVRYCGM